MDLGHLIKKARNAARMTERRAILTVAQLAAINADRRQIRATQPDAERDAVNAGRREIRATQPEARPSSTNWTSSINRK